MSKYEELEHGPDMPLPLDERTELHICPNEACGKSSVVIVAGEGIGDEIDVDTYNHYRVECRCPDCEWHGEGIHPKEKIIAYRGVQQVEREKLVQELALLTRKNMRESARPFLSALQEDRILPEDF